MVFLGLACSGGGCTLLEAVEEGRGRVNLSGEDVDLSGGLGWSGDRRKE